MLAQEGELIEGAELGSDYVLGVYRRPARFRRMSTSIEQR